MKKYSIGKFGGVSHITEETTRSARIFAFGFGADYSQAPNQQHRQTYTKDDAQAVVDWLNERATGYAPKTPPR